MEPPPEMTEEYLAVMQQVNDSLPAGTPDEQRTAIVKEALEKYVAEVVNRLTNEVEDDVATITHEHHKDTEASSVQAKLEDLRKEMD
jgi:hypothetical protein